MANTALVYDDIYLRHFTGAGHPERSVRLEAIVDGLKRSGLLDELVRIEPTAADARSITAVHSADYVERVRRSCARGIGFIDSLDTPVCRESFDVALAAVGGVLAAVDAVVEGKVQNAFCAVRPPGHHALADQAMGFCLLNNVAIAARHIQDRHNLHKVLIVDWDVHHGNGTQAIFYRDSTVFYASVHRYPFYPGTGGAEERGAGEGLHTTVNVPLRVGAGNAEFSEALRQTITPAALEFRPDFVLISAGFDSHVDDPVGGMVVTAEGFKEQTALVNQIAQECCGGRLVSVLEGGYSLNGLAASTVAHVRELIGK